MADPVPCCLLAHCLCSRVVFPGRPGLVLNHTCCHAVRYSSRLRRCQRRENRGDMGYHMAEGACLPCVKRPTFESPKPHAFRVPPAWCSSTVVCGTAATMDAPSPPDLRGSWHALGESHSLGTLLFLLIDLPEQSLKLRDQPVHVALSPHTELPSLCHTIAYEYAYEHAQCKGPDTDLYRDVQHGVSLPIPPIHLHTRHRRCPLPPKDRTACPYRPGPVSSSPSCSHISASISEHLSGRFTGAAQGRTATPAPHNPCPLPITDAPYGGLGATP